MTDDSADSSAADPSSDSSPVPEDPSLRVDARHDYQKSALEITEVDADPIAQFRTWFDEARAADLVEPAAMALGTIDRHGHPQVRMVLLREVRPDGFVFFTNYESAKGAELAAHPHAALTFHWDRLERQVRIIGAAERLDAAASDRYFDSRPRRSRIAAIASPQSQVISDRAMLERAFEEATSIAGEEGPIARPASWGGFVVRPHTIEYWQGRRHRLHDRLRYRAREGGWSIERLAP